MSNKKISALTSATTPLAGTETLPIVQSSTTKQVSVANLTAGRAVDVASLTATGNVRGATLLSIAASGTNGVNIGDYGSDAGTFRIAAISGRNLTFNNDYAGVEDARFDADGNYKVTRGNLVIGTSGKGIDFSATAGTGTSELLADYEEGTWTPTQGNFGTWTSPVFSATYVKIGRSVTVNVRQTSGTIASGAAQRYINGLPFSTAVAGATGVSSNGSIIFVSNLLLYSDGKIYFISDTGSQTSLQFSLTYQV